MRVMLRMYMEILYVGLNFLSGNACTMSGTLLSSLECLFKRTTLIEAATLCSMCGVSGFSAYWDNL